MLNTNPTPPSFLIRLPAATPSNNIIKSMHFAQYRKLRKAWQAHVLLALGGRIPRIPLERASLEVIRGSVGMLDWDNALGGLKPLFDCLVLPSECNPDGLGLILDDNPRCIPEAPRMLQVPAKRGQGWTEVRIWAV